ncbi:MAG: beta-barrel assembly-enhancing protease [Desulforhopalus sp.]
MAEKNLKTQWTKTLVWVLVIIFGLFCQMSPARAFTIGEEREMGEKLLYSIRSSFALVDDPDITQYLTRLGDSVLEVAGIQYFNYHFYVIDDKEFNAFAAPSGLIFFYSGLIGKMNSENELVSVLAHEIGHIVKRHLASRIEKGTYSSIASLGLALAALAVGGNATPALLTGALATGQSLNLHFSRQNEEEADLLAYGWMKELHRDPQGQAEMLESMRRIARYRSDKLPQYLLTHPNPEARLAYIESLLDSDQQKKQNGYQKTDDFEFYRFKYRIMAEVKDNRVFKNYLASVMADNRSSEFQKIMATYGMSQVRKNENDFDNSLSLLDKVMHYFPAKNELVVDRGVIEFEAGKYTEAERTLKNALGVDSRNMYATFTLGQLLYRTGRLGEAEKYFKTVSFDLPEYPKVYFELGKIASDNKQSGLSSFYLGKYDLYEGKLELARQSFRSALRDPKLPEAEKKESKELEEKIEKLLED